jgi:hypothetical protein
VPELNANTPPAYVQTAVQVAKDPARRANLGRRIREASTDLFEDAWPVKELAEFFLEAVYRSRSFVAS